jgi:hypothetical protein
MKGSLFMCAHRCRYVKQQLHVNIRHAVHISIFTWAAIGMVWAFLVGGVWMFRKVGGDTREDEHLAFVNGAQRRQLGGGGAGDAALGPNCTQSDEFWECANENTAFASVFASAAAGWTLFVAQWVICMSLEFKCASSVHPAPAAAAAALFDPNEMYYCEPLASQRMHCAVQAPRSLVLGLSWRRGRVHCAGGRNASRCVGFPQHQISRASMLLNPARSG